MNEEKMYIPSGLKTRDGKDIMCYTGEFYLKNKEKEMEKNGFTTTGIKNQKIHLKNWKYFYTKNAGPVFNYYAFTDDNKLYSVELINQSSSFSQEIKSKCDANFDKITSSLEIK